MAIDEKRIKQFLEANPQRGTVAAVVRRAGFRITWVLSHRLELWGLYLRPDENLQELLGTSREILLWITEFNDFQARALTQVTDIIEQEQPRLCEDIAIVASGDINSRNRINESSIASQTYFVGFALKDFEQFAPYGKNSFVSALQEQLFTKDLYALSGAITNRRAFFGRDSLLKELLATLNTGTSHVALFGLRKTGKTSVLYRLVDLLHNSKQLVHVHIDLQRLDTINSTAEYFLWSIGEQLYLGHASVRAVHGLRLFGQHGMFSDINDKSSIIERFDHDIRLIVTKTQRIFLIMFDEIELMSPETPGSNWGDAYVRCWRLLRGLDQSYPGRIRFLIAGTNPRCVEVNQLNGKENPTYNYFTKKYLGPLTEQESKELTSTLGRRMGLDWEHSALLKVYHIVGGHPFLLRAFCSRVHRSLLPRATIVKVSERIVTGLISTVLLDISSTLSQMVEVLEGQYSNEYYLLQLLATGRVGEFNGMAEAFPEDVAHLQGYGLISFRPSISTLTVEILQTWLQRRAHERSSTPLQGMSNSFVPGTVTDNYVIESILGIPGGFGTVYKAHLLDNQSLKLALKVLRTGSLASLQREVDVLREINHPAIVRILDHGRFSTGEVYVAMEYLEGPTLREFCTRAARLNVIDASRILKKLLTALTELHPNEEKIAKFRDKNDLTVSDYRELEIARHGYVHRDIKPENIIVIDFDRPVLIDFGISTRVSTPIKTITSTPGYLPPDGIAGVWNPDVDLYQLGLTMLQATSGVLYNGLNADDMRKIIASEISDPILRVILKLSSPTREERYHTARQALGDLGK